MNINRKQIDGDQIFWGLFLVGIGTLLLLSRLGIADVSLSWMFRNLWPLFIVSVGMSKLFHRRAVWAGLWMIAIGAWLQAVTLHFQGLTYESSWPLLLVVLGAGVILRTIVESARRRHAEEQEDHHV